jgi:uncharacterized protein YecE (DUF72 family)
MRVLAGTSGFAYKEWNGTFYPADLGADGMLAYYAGRFPTVEINNSFYRMPKESVLRGWAADVPPEFTFCLKASRRITHQQRLKDVAPLLEYIFRTAAVLEERQGPMLFQLPPFLRKDVPRLRAFLDALPTGARAAIEWRHDSWHDDEVLDLLRARQVACVVAESEEGTSPMVATATWGYLRLHRAGYQEEDLRAWVERIAAMPWETAFVFFKHEEEIAGPTVSLRFLELAGGAG